MEEGADDVELPPAADAGVVDELEFSVDVLESDSAVVDPGDEVEVAPVLDFALLDS